MEDVLEAPSDSKAVRITLKPHQTKAISEMADGKILCGGVGTGKTITALAYYVKNHSPKDVYVITTSRKRDDLDWDREALYFNIGTEPDATAHGTLRVDSWNNVAKYADVKDAFFIFDEQRVVGSGKWTSSFLKIAKRNAWILLSATPGDNWLDYVPVFIANGFYKNRTEFKERHVVYDTYVKYPKVKRYLDEGRLIKIRRHLLVDMPYTRHTRRHVKLVDVDYDMEAVNDISERRWNVFKDAPCKNFTEMLSVMRRLVNSHESRLAKVGEIVDAVDKVIIFYNYDYELEILRSLSEKRKTAEWNGHKHEPIPDTDQWVYLVQYTAGAEAWNCVETDTVVYWSLNYSWRIFEQTQGRIDRMNTKFTDLKYYVFKSKAPIDTAIWTALSKKKDFNKKAFSSHFK